MAALGCLLALLSGVAALGTPGAAARADGPETSRAVNRPLGVIGDEFSLVLTRRAVAPGETRVQFQNSGEDDHDLLIRRRGATRTRAFGIVGPGEQLTLPVRFRARSRYRLWCSVADHRERGMRATLPVKHR